MTLELILPTHVTAGAHRRRQSIIGSLLAVDWLFVGGVLVLLGGATAVLITRDHFVGGLFIVALILVARAICKGFYRDFPPRSKFQRVAYVGIGLFLRAAAWTAVAGWFLS